MKNVGTSENRVSIIFKPRRRKVLGKYVISKATVFMTMQTQLEIVHRCQKVMSHAWVVRTFIKHCDEVEDFPELMNIARIIFDTSCALETRLDDPAQYLRMLQKKIGKFQKAVEQFHIDAPQASTHTNFVQAGISLQTSLDDLQSLLQLGLSLPE
ncbi:hypothetical protein MNBD_PLANCTO02-1194 [hydrothermal vent metagenome]|uniref:Uncharacterized protein n=1 Tax=hydrothermal vent metagenome TaxID=652676 RepID=A0A3B1DIU2_9ZZZZ